MQHRPTTVVIRLRAKAEQADRLEARLIQLNDAVATEPHYGGVQINRDGERFLMYERWASRVYFEGAHQHTDHLQAFMAELKPMLAEPLEISFLQLVKGYGEFSE